MTAMLDRACMAVALSPALDRLIQLAKDEDAQSGNQGNATANCVVEMVIAAFEAVKTPTPSLSRIGRNAVLSSNASPYSDYSVSIGQGFSAMIGAILDGEE